MAIRFVVLMVVNSKQKTLELGKVYTVDTSMNTTEDRVYIKENKRFSFLKSRFKLLEEWLWVLSEH